MAAEGSSGGSTLLLDMRRGVSRARGALGPLPARSLILGLALGSLVGVDGDVFIGNRCLHSDVDGTARNLQIRTAGTVGLDRFRWLLLYSAAPRTEGSRRAWFLRYLIRSQRLRWTACALSLIHI